MGRRVGQPIVRDRCFSAFSMDLEAGYDPTGVQVWRVTDSSPRLECAVVDGGSRGAEPARRMR